METKQNKQKKQFTELSDEELKNVTGGSKFTITPPSASIALIGHIDLGGGDELASKSCPPGYKLDMDSCQCVQD